MACVHHSHEFRGYIDLFQRLEQDFPLPDQNGRVLFAVQDQKRRIIRTNIRHGTCQSKIEIPKYAAGTIASQIIGQHYPGSGTPNGQALTFGRIAGQNAAAERPVG